MGGVKAIKKLTTTDWLKIIVFVPFIVVGITSIPVVIIRFFQERERNYKNVGYAVCMYTGSSIYGTKGSTKSVADYVFLVNGKEYRSEGGYHKYLVPGEKYMIKYNKDNPAQSKVLIEEPVFLKSEPIDSTFAVINEIGTNYSRVDYAYEVGKKIYVRSQFFPRKFSLDTVVAFDKFRVYYWVERPGVAIINIKKKIK